MYGVIYTITHLESGKSYVGQTTQRPMKRWTGHKVQSRKPRWPIGLAIAKYGPEAFRFSVVQECEDRASLDDAERKWIAVIAPAYNLTLGGGGTAGFKFSPEYCARLGDRMRGRVVSEETARKIAASKKGMRQTAEQIAKSAAARRGRPHTEERRNKIGAAHKGKKHSPEHREKISASRKDYRVPESARLAISRPVVAEGESFSGVFAAATALGVSMGVINRRIAKGWPGYSTEKPALRRRPRTPEQVARLVAHIAKAVRVDGCKFPSAASASVALGISRTTIRDRIRAGAPGYSWAEAS